MIRIGAYNMDLQEQMQCFIEIIHENEVVKEVLDRALYLRLEHYYIGAGCLTQTVWNYLSGYPLDYGISDVDLVYYDGQRLSFYEEDKVVRQVNELYDDLPVKIDVKNQARVHLWYEQRFGYAIQPYRSLEEAINTWPTTATAVAIRKLASGDCKITLRLA